MDGIWNTTTTGNFVIPRLINHSMLQLKHIASYLNIYDEMTGSYKKTGKISPSETWILFACEKKTIQLNYKQITWHYNIFKDWTIMLDRSYWTESGKWVWAVKKIIDRVTIGKNVYKRPKLKNINQVEQNNSKDFHITIKN